ncbi:unnamed protein product [Sphagnum jensenii]|uniref:Uncharacterized protein n=1 Tax=Sphagnum jensenii TaxID=128206 RepID=A0ABP1BCB3_9BRYO
MRDQEMLESLESPICHKGGARPEAEQLREGGPMPNAKLHFGIPELMGSCTKATEACASPGESNREARRLNRPHGEATEGWAFQGRRRHTPKLASPRQDASQSPSHTPQREATPGGKRGLMHSEIHPSFFTSLGIPIQSNKEPFLANPG